MYLSKSQISEGKYVSWLGDQRIATSIKTPLIDGGFPPQIFQIYLKMFDKLHCMQCASWQLKRQDWIVTKLRASSPQTFLEYIWNHERLTRKIHPNIEKNIISIILCFRVCLAERETFGNKTLELVQSLNTLN